MLAGCIGILSIFLVASVASGWLFSTLWNAVAVPLFGWPLIDTWMAIGLLLLVGMLTGGFNAVVKK